MTNPTFFKDRRTGTVYRFNEKTVPVEGPIPLKAAYREDTVWINQQHLERVQDPHKMTGGRAVWFLVLTLMVAALWVYSGVNTHDHLHISMASALWLNLGWALVIWGIVIKHSGTAHS